MRTRRLLLALIAVALSSPLLARAQGEVTLIAPLGIKAAIDQMIPDFEKKTGYKVKPTYGSGGVTKAQIVKGDPFDVPIVQPPYPDVVASGNVVASTEKPLATVSVGVAVRKGAPKPDISTPEAIKKMLLAAKSIAHPDPSAGATAGITTVEVFKKLGISEQLQPKIKIGPPGGGTMALLAKGEVEIGITFVSEMNVPGVDLVGPLPKDMAPPTTLVGFVSSHAKNAAGAKALLDYLSSPEAASAYKAQGMQPAR